MNWSFERIQNALRAAGEPTRLRLMHLCAVGEQTVGDLVDVMAQSQPRISRHLRILCDAGLLERFRDGQYVYFRVPLAGTAADVFAAIDALTAPDDPVIAADRAALDRVLGARQDGDADPLLRRFNRLVLDVFLTHPVGDLLDIGVGSGAILKLLARRARQAVGIDTDLASRRSARRAVARAALANCTVRAGDMNALGFDDASFDTVVLDCVLLDAEAPAAGVAEAFRVLRPGGRLLVTEYVDVADGASAAQRVGRILAASGVRCGPVRQASDTRGRHLVTVASPDSMAQQETA